MQFPLFLKLIIAVIISYWQIWFQAKYSGHAYFESVRNKNNEQRQ